MKSGPHCNYEILDQLKLNDGVAVALLSSRPEDRSWDHFLQQTRLGQFQQSTFWSRTKTTEGWRVVRVIVKLGEKIVGGFQILWLSTWRGRMAYISKGPVVLPGHPGLPEYVIRLLRKTTKKERFRALVVQPPDMCEQLSSLLLLNNFDVDCLAHVNDATWIIDLAKGQKTVEQNMSKTTRREIRDAVTQGMHIREGRREDINIFFELMLSTCGRQGVPPSPSNIASFFALWDAGSGKHFRITLAEHEGKPVAGLACILFGQTVSVWKKGWISSNNKVFPNALLTHELLTFAIQNGYRFADFCAFDRKMAIGMLQGERPSPEQARTRHIFHVRLGGSPRLLPKARIYFPNGLFRLAYRATFRPRD